MQPCWKDGESEFHWNAAEISVPWRDFFFLCTIPVLLKVSAYEKGSEELLSAE